MPELIMDHQIKWDEDYFAQKVKADYSDWQFAWAREAGQNSLDANASKIEITTNVVGNDTVVTWIDNGCGMDLETLHAKFMAIGGTKKANGATGGFGIAKIILAFAHKNYSIRTSTYEARGVGARYGVIEGLPEYPGLKLTVTMFGDVKYDIDRKIRKWCNFSTTKASITLNGTPVNTIQLGKPRFTTDWCKVYSHNSSSSWGYEARVRINGQYMFSIYTSISTHVIVDLLGTASTDFFTSNRDSLNYEWGAKLQRLIEEIYENPNKIKDVPENIKFFPGNMGRISMSDKASVPPCENDNDISHNGDGDGLPSSEEMTALKTQLSITEFKAPPLLPLKGRIPLIDGHNFIVVNSTDKEVPQKWMPGTMNVPAQRLMSKWTKIIQTCGKILKRAELFTPGWVFSREARAEYRFHSEYGHIILLNPVDILLTKFKNHWTDDFDSFYELVAVAVHEIIHIDQPNHGTGFARDFTYAMGKIMANRTMFESIRKG